MRKMLAVILGLSLFVSSGCAVKMATKQPEKKDLSVLNPGTHRSLVRAELGNPAWEGNEDGKDVELYSFKQGFHKGTKAARALFHGAADVFTLGLWEAVGTPAESLASGTEVKVRVYYDKANKVEKIDVLQGDKVVNLRQKETTKSDQNKETKM